MARERLTDAAGRLARAAHARGYLPGRSSGAVRLLARWFANRGTYTYRDHCGHLVEADLTDYMERCGFFGAHSSNLLKHVVSKLRPGDWAIDAGANVGLFTSAMCAAVGSDGSVWAVEPLARNVDRLRLLKEANGLRQLRIWPLALSSSASTAHLRLPAAPGGSGFGSFAATWETAGEVKVPTNRLDDLVASADPGRPLRLLKVDVEGHEVHLLEGARTTLTERRPLVVCEAHDPLLRSAGSSAEALCAWFESCGYRPRAPFGRPPGSLDGAIFDMLLVPEPLDPSPA